MGFKFKQFDSGAYTINHLIRSQQSLLISETPVGCYEAGQGATKGPINFAHVG